MLLINKGVELKIEIKKIGKIKPKGIKKGKLDNLEDHRNIDTGDPYNYFNSQELIFNKSDPEIKNIMQKEFAEAIREFVTLK